MDVPEEVTITILGGRNGVPLGRFIDQMRELLRALVAIDAGLSEDHKKTIRWVIVQASYNSPLMVRVAPRPLHGRTPNEGVPGKFVGGLRALEEGSEEPPDFAPVVLESMRKAFYTESEAGGQVVVSDSTGREVRPTKRLVGNIENILRHKYYFEYSTLEGRLETIDIHEGRKFYIYDVLNGLRTRCKFGPDRDAKVLEAMGHRVAVSGLVSYNRRDEPVSIDVDGFETFSDLEGAPLFPDGEQIDITGGLGSVEFVRRGRDAE